jgi:hypothetical protein
MLLAVQVVAGVRLVQQVTIAHKQAVAQVAEQVIT